MHRGKAFTKYAFIAAPLRALELGTNGWAPRKYKHQGPQASSDDPSPSRRVPPAKSEQGQYQGKAKTQIILPCRASSPASLSHPQVQSEPYLIPRFPDRLGPSFDCRGHTCSLAKELGYRSHPPVPLGELISGFQLPSFVPPVRGDIRHVGPVSPKSWVTSRPQYRVARRLPFPLSLLPAGWSRPTFAFEG